MRTPRKLPEGLGDAFAVRAAHDAGIGDSRLRLADLEVPFHGARMRVQDETDEARLPAEAERVDAMRRIRAFAAIMPKHAFFIGPTAALVARVPLPNGLHGSLHVGVPADCNPPRRPGIVGRRMNVFRYGLVDGLRIAAPATTWATLATSLGEYDLVAATDHILREPHSPGGFYAPERAKPIAVRDDLERVLASNRWIGAQALRCALERARTRSASRPETWLRLILVDAGLPEPLLNHDISSERGEFLACADLAYPDLRIAIEYEGDGHRDRRRFERDINRFANLHDNEWSALRFTSEHVFRRPSIPPTRVARARERALIVAKRAGHAPISTDSQR